MYDIQLALLLTLFGFASCQDPNCDFYQKVTATSTYYIYNVGYSSNYTPGVQCRWIAECPTGYNCRLDCTVEMPLTQSCTGDRLLISEIGDYQLSGAKSYCGKGTVTAVSTNQLISVGLITSRNSPGGRFYCTLTAQVASSTNPTCSCGQKKQTRIVGGQETGVNEYPFMVGLADSSSYTIYCGGTIISSRYVLTAAHCVFDRQPNTIAAVVGEHDVTTGDSTATKAYGITQFTVHPQFNPDLYDYDIAILTTASEIQFGPLVGQVCLPYKYGNADLTGIKVIVLGWGTLFFGGPRSNVLQQVTLDVISDSSCKQKEPTLTARQFCTYTSGKDACQFDSGGPVLYLDSTTGLYFDLGIVSKGRGCATNSPGIQTRLSSLLTWIENNTPGANYCRK